MRRSRLPILTDFLGPSQAPVVPGSDVLSHVGSALPDVARDGFPEVRPNEIALMFSGGVDSTATAVMLAERYERVHLICYRNGYGHYYHHRTEERVHELNRRLGDRFTFSLIKVKGYFDRILVDRVLSDYKEYRSGFIWFMGCKMAMHLRSVIYCLEHGLLACPHHPLIHFFLRQYNHFFNTSRVNPAIFNQLLHGQPRSFTANGVEGA